MTLSNWIKLSGLLVTAGIALMTPVDPAGMLGHGLFGSVAAQAQAPADAAEKEAFEAAKELGTVEAWDAFLSNYSKGFRADLARAYVKKLGAAVPVVTPAPTPAQPAVATPAPSPAPTDSFELASQVPCTDLGKLKSYQSTDPVKIRFINQSGATRIIQWVDFNGSLQEFYTLKPGEQRLQETFLTHPWIAAYEEGSCVQMFMPGQPESIALLTPDGAINPRAAVTSAKSRARPQEVNETPEQTCANIGQDYNGIECVPRASAKPSKKTIERRAKASCAELGMAYINGQCAPKKKSERQRAAKNKNKACPAGMYRNPYGQCQPNETGG